MQSFKLFKCKFWLSHLSLNFCTCRCSRNYNELKLQMPFELITSSPFQSPCPNRKKKKKSEVTDQRGITADGEVQRNFQLQAHMVKKQCKCKQRHLKFIVNSYITTFLICLLVCTNQIFLNVLLSSRVEWTLYRPETLNGGFYNPCGGFFLVKGNLVSPTTDNTEKAFKSIGFVSDAKKRDRSNIHEFIGCCCF